MASAGIATTAVQVDGDSLRAIEDELEDGEFYYMRSSKSIRINFDPAAVDQLAEEVLKSGFAPLVLAFTSFFFLGTSLLRPHLDYVAWALAVGSVAGFVAVPALRVQKAKGLKRCKAHEWKPTTFLYYWLAISAAFGIVSVLWATNLYNVYVYPYQHYLDMKWMEHPINPLLQPADEFEDAGVVAFSSDSYLDRAHSTCYRASGISYCLVPIVQDTAGTGDRSRLPDSPSGTYDYFAVGTDCCSCPGPGDFRCGDWKYSDGQGGVRQLDNEERGFYRLAAEQWEATWGKDSRTPVFFEWRHRPFATIRALQEGFRSQLFTVSVGFTSALLFLAVVQNQLRTVYFERNEKHWAALADEDLSKTGS
ncbi:unnamed protein product [Amoebophrya sp. A25]|nr:unnamed protein product [Amoebophrya sp. A25]|eukprot:GSA25T00014161001.1